MEVAKRLEKPMMRRMYKRQIKIHLCGAFLGSILVGLAWKVFYMDPRKVALEKWFKYYDPDKHIEILKKTPYMQSLSGKRD